MKFYLVLFLVFILFTSVVSASYSVNDSGSWGIELEVQATPFANNCPSSSSLSIANKSTDVSISVGFWNVSISDSDGNNTNGSIECSNGDNTTWSDLGNGTRSLSLSTLSYDTNYTVWLNYTDGNVSCSMNESYWFTTAANPISYSVNDSGSWGIELKMEYYTWSDWSDWWIIYFNGTVSQISNIIPFNGNTSVSRGSVVLSADFNDVDSSSMNISWYYSDNNTLIGQNTSVGNGTYQQIINTGYSDVINWSINVSDGVNWNNQSLSFTVIDLNNVSNVSIENFNISCINLSWSKTSNVSHTYIRYKKDSAPSSRSDGTLLCNVTNTSWNHTGLDIGTHYYYSVWGYNSTDNVYSLVYVSGDNYTNPGSPNSLQETGSNTSRIDLSWDKGTNATRSVVFRNSSGVAEYPDRSNGVEVINTTGSSGSATGLDDNITYWFSVYSFNPASGLWSEGNSTDNATTSNLAGGVNSLSVVRYNDVQLNLSWTKSNSLDDVVVVRKTGSFPSNYNDGTKVYNGSLLTYKDTGLSPATKYYYRAWAWNGENYGSGYSSDTNITRPSPPSSFVGDIDSGNLIMTWTKGTGAARTIIRNNTGAYPANTTDGYLVYNDTGTTETVSGTSSVDYYRAWSYVVVDGEVVYSDPGTDLLWGGIEVQVFRQDLNHIAIENYSIFITNEDRTESYFNQSVSNPFRIDVSDVPNGINIMLQVEKQGFKTMSQTMDLYENTYYIVKFYLPPSSEGSPGSESGQDWYVPPEGELLTDIVSVDNSSTDEIVILQCVVDTIETIHVYNSSIYGGWIEVSSDKYTVVGGVVTINSSVFDINSDLIRITYYCGENQVYAYQYIINVQDTFRVPVEDAYVVIQKYINTSDEYETVHSEYTDSSGQLEVYLLPGTDYYFSISKEGYDTKTASWTPTEIEYAENIEKTFYLTTAEIDEGDVDEIHMDDMSLFAYNSTHMKIVYRNLNNDNSHVLFYFYDFIGSSILNITNVSNTPNNISFYFNHSNYTLTGDLIQVIAYAYRTNGSVYQTVKYFHINQSESSSNAASSAIAAILSIAMVLFGLTIAHPKKTLGVIGIIVMIIGIAITAFAAQTWYIHLIQAIEIILLIFIILTFKEENTNAV